MRALLWIAALSILSPRAQAADSTVVDLGQMSINGELRRPSVQWIDSKKALRPELPKIATEELIRLEDKLLKPAVLPEKEAKNVR